MWLKVPIMYCVKCLKPVPDSYHDFQEVCTCVDYKKEAKEKGWKIKFPKKVKVIKNEKINTH